MITSSVFGGLLALTYLAPGAVQDSFELSMSELEQMNRCVTNAKQFIKYAEIGSVTKAKALCASRIDREAPSTGDGNEVLGFKASESAEFKRAWAPAKYRVSGVESSFKNGKVQFFTVWGVSQNKSKYADVGLVFKPSTLKIVSIFDAGE